MKPSTPHKLKLAPDLQRYSACRHIISSWTCQSLLWRCGYNLSASIAPRSRALTNGRCNVVLTILQTVRRKQLQAVNVLYLLTASISISTCSLLSLRRLSSSQFMFLLGGLCSWTCKWSFEYHTGSTIACSEWKTWRSFLRKDNLSSPGLLKWHSRSKHVWQKPYRSQTWAAEDILDLQISASTSEGDLVEESAVLRILLL